MSESSGTRRRAPRSPRDTVAQRDDAAGIAAFLGGAVHALGGAFEELAALVGGDDGVDIEVEGIVDVLVGGAEGNADRLEHPPDAEELEGVAAEAIGANDPELGEAAGAGVTRKSAASRSLFQGDGSRDAIVLVMLEDQNIRLGTEAAGESRALIEDGVAVALFIGRDAGVGGDADDGTGHKDLQGEGKQSGVYERSGGAKRSRRTGILTVEANSVDTGPPTDSLSRAGMRVWGVDGRNRPTGGDKNRRNIRMAVADHVVEDQVVAGGSYDVFTPLLSSALTV